MSSIPPVYQTALRVYSTNVTGNFRFPSAYVIMLTIRITLTDETTRFIYEGSLPSMDTDERDYGFFKNTMHIIWIFDG